MIVNHLQVTDPITIPNNLTIQMMLATAYTVALETTVQTIFAVALVGSSVPHICILITTLTMFYNYLPLEDNGLAMFST